MTRSISASQKTAAQSEQGEAVHLVEVTTWDGMQENITRFTTAAQDIDADVGAGVVTFTGAGGLLSIGAVEESVDPKAQGVPITLSGVNTAFLAVLLSEDFRGRTIRIWQAWIDESAGTVIDAPLLRFRGRQNQEYRLKEVRPQDGSPGTATIETRAVSSLVDIQRVNAVRTNLASHQAMLARAGLSTADTFFEKVPGLANKPVFWGGPAPDRGSESSNQKTPRRQT